MSWGTWSRGRVRRSPACVRRAMASGRGADMRPSPARQLPKRSLAARRGSPAAWLCGGGERRQIWTSVRGSWIESACFLLTDKIEPYQRRARLNAGFLNSVLLTIGYDAIVSTFWLRRIFRLRTRSACHPRQPRVFPWASSPQWSAWSGTACSARPVCRRILSSSDANTHAATVNTECNTIDQFRDVP